MHLGLFIAAEYMLTLTACQGGVVYKWVDYENIEMMVDKWVVLVGTKKYVDKRLLN